MSHNCRRSLHKCSRSFFLLLLDKSVDLFTVKHNLWMLVPGAFCSDSFLQTLNWLVWCFCAPSREGELLAERDWRDSHLIQREQVDQWDFISNRKSYKWVICLNVSKWVSGLLSQLEGQSEDKSETHIWLSSEGNIAWDCNKVGCREVI